MRLKLEIDLMWEIVSSAQILQHPTDGSAPSWLADLARGKADVLRHLRQALRVYFRSAIEPHLPMIEDGLRTDAANGIQHCLHDDPAGLLGRFRPAASHVAQSEVGELGREVELAVSDAREEGRPLALVEAERDSRGMCCHDGVGADLGDGGNFVGAVDTLV